ncbi:hypothetical protein ACTXT7_010517 [Hymenolepis weldensis]
MSEKETEHLPRKSDDEDETTTKRQKCGRAFGEILRDFSHFCPVSFAILTIFVLGIFLLVYNGSAAVNVLVCEVRDY